MRYYNQCKGQGREQRLVEVIRNMKMNLLRRAELWGSVTPLPDRIHLHVYGQERVCITSGCIAFTRL